MSTVEFLLWSVLAVLGIGSSALWSGLETATYVVGRARLEARAAKPEPDRAARLLKAELDKPERVLAGLLILNNLSNYIGVLAVARLLSMTGFQTWQIALLNGVVLTPVLFILAETLPKEYFRVSAERLAYFFAPLLRLLRLILSATLILPGVVLIAKLVRRVVGSSHEPTPLDPRQRMVWLIGEAVGQGLVSQAQAELAKRAVAFRDTPLRTEMTPWGRVTRIRRDADPLMARRIASQCSHSRLPVVDHKGKIVGVISTVDLFLDESASLQSMLTEALTVESTLSARDALRTLRSESQTIAIVTSRDRPIGLVTMKDLVEPVTGELIAW